MTGRPTFIIGQRRKLATGMNAIQIHGFPDRAGPVEFIPEFLQGHRLRGFSMTRPSDDDRQRRAARPGHRQHHQV